MFNNFFSENRAVYDIMWKNTLQRAHWINKATDTHTEYVILIAFPQQGWLSEHASMLHYMHTACLVRWNVSKKLQFELNLQPHN
jgi:hypothetical protein